MADSKEQVIILKIKLDKQELKASIDEAEEDINKEQEAKSQKRRAKARRDQADSDGEGEPESESGLWAAVKNAMAGTKVGRAFSGAGESLGKMPIIGPVLKLSAAFVALTGAITLLASRLARFNPLISRDLRLFGLQLRGVNIMLGRALQPALSEFFRIISQIVALLTNALLPVIKLIVFLLTPILKAIAAVTSAVNRLLGIEDPLEQASRLNKAFLTSMQRVVDEDAQGASTSGAEEDDAKTSDGQTNIEPADKKVKESEERTVVRVAPLRQAPTLQPQVTFNIAQKLTHEETIQRAIEQIRTQLLFGIRQARNEILELQGILDAHIAVSGV